MGIIKFLDLQKINQQYSKEFQEAVKKVIDSGWFILGNEVKTFEKNFSDFCNVKHCIGGANGLDALRLIFNAYLETKKLKEGDEIIVPANTYIASVLAISENRLTPVFVEPDIQNYNIDPEKIEDAINPKTKAILLVHLYGNCAYNEKIPLHR